MSRTDCINALTQLADELGTSPTTSEFKQADTPVHLSTIYEHFDGWKDAKQAANLDTDDPITKADCLESIQTVAEELGESPSQPQYTRSEQATVSVTAITNRFDTWNTAKEAAGLEQYQITTTREDCLESIQAVADELKKSPSQEEYRDCKASFVAIETIREKWGSWQNAKDELGLEPCQKQFSETECISALQTVADAIGESPTIEQFDESDIVQISSKTVMKWCGDWNTAKEKAGLEKCQQVSKQDCLDSLERVADELGKSPTRDEYKDCNLATVSPTAIGKKCGSWNKAKQELDLSPCSVDSTSRKECLYSLQRVAETMGEKFSMREHDSCVESTVTSTTIKRKFESWNVAKDIAGLQTYEPQACPSTYDEQDCIDALLSVAEHIGHSPTKDEYNACEKSPMTSMTIRAICGGFNSAKRSAGLSITKPRPDRTVNNSYFEQIDSSTKAYWLGFLYGDGYISSTQWGADSVGITLQARDRQILEDFRSAVGSDHAIFTWSKDGDEYVEISISKSEFTRNLKRKGLTLDKTFSSCLPEIETKHYPAFVRGLFDADGYIDDSQWKIDSGSKGRLEELQTWLPMGSHVNGPYRETEYILKVSSNRDYQHLCEWLYPDGQDTTPSLTRKLKTAVNNTTTIQESIFAFHGAGSQ